WIFALNRIDFSVVAMKLALYFFISCCLASSILFAQSPAGGGFPLELGSTKYGNSEDGVAKMLCDPSATLMITSLTAETPATGDNDPGNGAIMSWDATGSSTGFYYTTLESASFPVSPLTPVGSGVSVYPAPADDMINWTIGFGGSQVNTCIPTGT
ncbi:MAG: hypothetical protein AAGA62_07820, partial [Bacteroidota bacterium]